uniref:Uncharacterized protein n=1 Tax=Candidatus Kentrum sp. FM TaxID=2126340 RepID=A0A450S3Q6_9GAMM|nr:MAG: hypothetical protein BECKFM1743A_GA0114220_100355 [Candidatus Kentron sp. FM]VFJ49562.1 MAG: hypothetical protein BECKFM1743C_GA0114222_100727 [Candidatus Kentron sp. FM]VFK07279.1 MAG: hypothetical protein BECKFM1743B_GA0114221_100366 [Candidatus Kentron sp. FM]
MLLIETPETHAVERDYILSVILGEFLGLLLWRRILSNRDDVRITLATQPGEIRLPDVLFSTPDAQWLTEASMPPQPLDRWDTRVLNPSMTLPVFRVCHEVFSFRSISSG